jgi:nucleoside 2-deoxyribosyltransferase
LAKKVFVIQPQSHSYDAAYKMIRQAASEAGVEVFRIDDLLGEMPDDVWATTSAGIETSDGVICDVSESKSGNIAFEVGFSTALEKPVILIANTFEPSFPLPGMRILRYASDVNGNDAAFIHYLSVELHSAMDNAAAVAELDEEAVPDSVFVSYSHNDQHFLHRLLVHLRPLEKQGRIKRQMERRNSKGTERI